MLRIGKICKINYIVISFRIAQAKEHSLDKERTSYSDSLDALRLSLKNYNIK